MPDFFAERTLAEAVVVLGLFAAAMAGIAAVAFRVRTRYLLGVGLVLAVLQGFVPFSYISWFLLFGMSLLPVAVHRARRQDASVWLWTLAGIAAVQAVSVLWSPSIGAVAHAVLSSIVLGVFVLLWSAEARETPSLAPSLLIAAPALVAFAVLVWVFRLSPVAESAYLRSPIARWLAEPGVELISNGRWLNVFDPDKSGALMLNGNIASLFMLLVAVLYTWSALRTPPGRARWMLASVAAVAFSAIFATGSKTPLFLMVIAPLLALGTAALVRRGRLALAILGVGAVVIAGLVVVAAALGLTQAAIATLMTRSAYWQLAAMEFPTHWLLGLGHGGWDTALRENWVALYGTHLGFQGYPPHNFVLQAWSDAGVIHALASVFITALPIALLVQAMRADRSESLWSIRTVGDMVLFVGLVWAPLHALTDTTTFFGDNHTIPVYAALVALALLRARAAKQRGDSAHAASVSAQLPS